MTTAIPTHEKQISKVPPWAVLITGAAMLFGGALVFVVDAVRGELTTGTALILGGLAFIGVVLIGIGAVLHKRAEDWDHWQIPARQIAETHDEVRENATAIGQIATEVKALRASIAETVREIYAAGYTDGIAHAQRNGAVPLRLVQPSDRPTN